MRTFLALLCVVAAIVAAAVVPRMLARWIAPKLPAEPSLGTTGAVMLVTMAWLGVAGAFAAVAWRAHESPAETPVVFAGMVLGASLFVVGGTFMGASSSEGVTTGGDHARIAGLERELAWRRRRSPTSDDRDRDGGEGFVLFVVGIALLFASHVRLAQRSPLTALGAGGLAVMWGFVVLAVTKLFTH
ncbi:MAG: hypothetical protein JST00_03770 [Deltaproteobacteria bacterium]|nr:hypothetical protein [Deltaproteobacteria bacterium]